MPYDAQTALRGSGRGNPAAIASWAIARGAARSDDVRAYLDTVYRMAPVLGINPDVVVAQSHLETDGWRSLWWVSRVNAAGIGITGDPVQNAASRDFGTGEASARAHLLHLHLYVNGATVPTGFLETDDPRWDAAIRAGYAGIADTLDDLNGRWAIDPDNAYGEKIAGRLNLMEAAGLLPATVEASPMALKRYDWPGLANPVYLPDWITVEVKLITNNRVRSFQKSSAHKFTTFHDTGNPNTTADGEWTWANNGRQGAGVGGYNGIFDSRKVIICQPFDEVIWAAGTDLGNRTSYHFEMAYGGGQDYSKVLAVGYAVHGAVCAAKGWNVDTALVKHQYWYGKWCPATILNRGIWSQVIKGVSDAAATARAAAGGDGTGGAPVVYAKPSPIAVLDAISKGSGLAPQRIHDDSSGVDFIWCGDRGRVIRNTPRYRYAVRNGEKIGPDLQKGEEFDYDWLFQAQDGNWWLMTPYGTRVFADDVERISDSKGEAAA